MEQISRVPKPVKAQEMSSKAVAERLKLVRKVGLFVFVLVAGALFCVWSRVKVVQMGYEVTSLQETLLELTKEASHLEIEVERLKSPAHLEAVAVDVLKMRPPRSEEIVILKGDR